MLFTDIFYCVVLNSLQNGEDEEDDYAGEEQIQEEGAIDEVADDNMEE